MVVASRRRLNWEGGTPSAARLVVGDRVSVEMKGEEGVVVAVHSRANSIIRRAPRSERPQIIAANVDQALLVFAAKIPEPKRGLLDRFLVACSLAGIQSVITINKTDQGMDAVEEWLGIYEGLGYEVLRVSARTAWGLGRIKRLLQERTTLFCGPSGAGKSSLLNAVYPGFRLKEGAVSQATGKGTHTTTMAELMPLPYGGFVVDTPGLKEFGLWRATREELEEFFPEISELAGHCRFANCSHSHEPDCAVVQAVEDGTIDSHRHRSFSKLLAEIDEPS
jgi:ribosome biogenesis GTPase